MTGATRSGGSAVLRVGDRIRFDGVAQTVVGLSGTRELSRTRELSGTKELGSVGVVSLRRSCNSSLSDGASNAFLPVNTS